MQLYNTLTRTIEEVAPLDGEEYRVYSCGPTVYDSIHIGNLSAFIMADTLRRSLAIEGTRVKHIMNITDVDDKTIRRSQQQYPDLPALDALKLLTEKYAELFFNDMSASGNELEPVTFVRATDNIHEMQTLIRSLHAGGFAYIADDGVYFSIKAYIDSGKVYGQLSPISASSTATSRIQNDEYDKESAQDFALWKTEKAGEPAWDFQLDGHNVRGRPGWHIECSIMSTANLGQPFDIHTGGVDLIFPHHENEIAQSTAGKPDPVYALHFVHNEHILVEGKKMSKSLGNFYTLQDIRHKEYDPLAFRLLVLQSHYRSQAHFSWENLASAQRRLQKLRNIAELRHQLQNREGVSGNTIKESIALVKAAITHDLNTPAALETIALIIDDFDGKGIGKESEQPFMRWLQTIDDLLGLRLLQTTPDITPEQKAIIKKRESAREAKDWETSDKLRDELQQYGIGIRDVVDGTIWYRS